MSSVRCNRIETAKRNSIDVAAVLHVDPALEFVCGGYLAAVLYRFCVCHYSCFVLTEDSIARQTVYTNCCINSIEVITGMSGTYKHFEESHICYEGSG
jgi:hypothetical protein